MRNVAILSARLDVPFKNLGPVPMRHGPIPPIRVPWKRFVDTLATWHYWQHDEVLIIEKPLWQFDLEYVRELIDYDVVYMPHKQKIDFDAGNNIIYYAQTVFPDWFTIDWNGWGYSCKFCPVSTTIPQSLDETKILFENLQKRISNNISKFDQPSRKPFKMNDFLLFVCQIPHDEVIKYHSEVAVVDALKATLEFGQRLGKPVVVKGHPVNPGSMHELREVTKKYHGIWIDDYSIHDLIEKAEAVFLVNSGVGIETLLHRKPLYQFGHSEYENFSTMVMPLVDQISKVYNPIAIKEEQCLAFFANYFEWLFDSRDSNSFGKLKEILENHV